MKEEWDRNHWQGRTRKQVEDTAKIVSWIMVITAIITGAILIYYLLT